MCNSHTEKVENFLTKISHKILCDIHMIVFTVYQYVRLCRDSHIETLREAIAGVIADPYFSIPTEEAKSCLRCARVMIQAFSQPKELHQIFFHLASYKLKNDNTIL